MNKFERGLNPKEAMNVGFKSVFEKADLKIAYTRMDGWPVFLHNKNNNAGLGIFPKDWTSEQLRLIADYMEAYPEELKNKEMIDDVPLLTDLPCLKPDNDFPF